jgi:HSP20 family protein
MTMKSLIPVGRERAVSRPEANPFATPQQEIGRLFDGLTRSFLQFPCLRPCAQHGP